MRWDTRKLWTHQIDLIRRLRNDQLDFVANRSNLDPLGHLGFDLTETDRAKVKSTQIAQQPSIRISNNCGQGKRKRWMGDNTVRSDDALRHRQNSNEVFIL